MNLVRQCTCEIKLTGIFFAKILISSFTMDILGGRPKNVPEEEVSALFFKNSSKASLL
jgi:hypothetical protein